MILITTSFEVATGCALVSLLPKNHLGDAPRQAVLGDHQARTLEASNFSHVPAYMLAYAGGAPEAFLHGRAVGNAVGPDAVGSGAVPAAVPAAVPVAAPAVAPDVEPAAAPGAVPVVVPVVVPDAVVPGAVLGAVGSGVGPGAVAAFAVAVNHAGA